MKAKVIKEGDITPISELKAEIKREFIKEVEDKIRSSKYVLGQKDWASTDSNYHKECRIREQLEIEYFEKILKKIK